MHNHDEILIALVGQPNSGKSTVFNFLTGLHQTIANYPGVTVTKKSGHYHDGPRRIEVVDLPGTYSLTSYSQEERVTRDFLLLERPEAVVVVLDASNLRRHLYLVFQLRELRIPLIVCLNMMDVAQRRRLDVDAKELANMLGVPVVPTTGRSGAGLDELRKKINEISALHDHDPEEEWKIHYGNLEPLIAECEQNLSRNEFLVKDYSPRWLAIKLLENDREARRIVQHHIHDKDWETFLGSCLHRIEAYETETGDSPRKTIAAKRNECAEEVEKRCIRRTSVPKRNSDRFDRVLCHPVLGFFGVAAVLFLTFYLAFNISDGWNWFPWLCHGENSVELEFTTPVAACENLFSDWIPRFLDRTFALRGDLKSLVYDGVVSGIGGVLTFAPVIFTIFFFISLLNQSGYMARVIVVMDRLMRVFGLNGQSVLPMILGGGIAGGCAVPAVMATRTMREPRERLLTIMVIPLMNCGAKIPLYGVLIAAFFSAYQALAMTGIIFLSWALALFSAWMLSKTFVQGSATPLIIELPSYQRPSVFEALATACRQSWLFLKKAGTVILAINVLLWALMYYPAPANLQASEAERLSGSYAAMLGKMLEPASQFAGFDWRDNIALVGGFAAKEVIVSSLSTIYGLENGDQELSAALKTAPNWSPAKALALLIFVMVYAPCMATCAAIRQETRSWKLTLVTVIYATVLAAVLAVAVYQIAVHLGHV